MITVKTTALELNGTPPNENQKNENKVMESVSGGSPSASSCDSGISMNADSLNDRLTSFQLDNERKIENMIDDKLNKQLLGNLHVEKP